MTSCHPTKVFAVRRPRHGLNLLLEFQNLLMLGHESFIVATVIQQAAKALRDKPLLAELERILRRQRTPEAVADVPHKVCGGTGGARTPLEHLHLTPVRIRRGRSSSRTRVVQTAGSRP